MKIRPRQNRYAAIFFMILFHAENVSAQFGMEREIAEDSGSGIFSGFLGAILTLGLFWLLKEIFGDDEPRETHNDYDKSHKTNTNRDSSKGQVNSTNSLHKSSISEQEKSSCTNRSLREGYSGCKFNELIKTEEPSKAIQNITDFSLKDELLIVKDGVDGGLSTYIKDSDKIGLTKDEYSVVYSSDGKKLLACEEKGTIGEPLEDDFGNKVICFNNQYIDYYTFLHTRGYYYIIKPNTEIICDKAFSNCDDLLGIEIPESVKSIGCRAFQLCKAMNEIIIPNEITRIKEYCFFACIELRFVTLPSRLISIEEAAFFGCENLKMIEIPVGLKKIGDNAFKFCSLEEIHLPDGLEVIGAFAFDSTPLTRIVIPEKVNMIGKFAFANCNSLKIVEFKGFDVDFDETAFASLVNPYGEYKELFLDVIYVPKGYKSKFVQKTPKYEHIIVETE